MGVLGKNRAFFFFLLRFGLSYLILSGIYWLYLSQFDADSHEPDGMTRIVAYQAQDFVNLLGEDAFTRPRTYENSFRFYINDTSVARIVEGCNAISVMILFTAFIIAFASTFKRTAVYIVLGIIIIHILNVIRVGLLCLSFYYYPEYETFVHDILFPLFIYGVVFVLWIFWVTKFSGHAKAAA